MKRNNFIFKSISVFLLTLLFYMHLCSSLCATGGYGCCGDEDNDPHKKVCCSDEKKSDKESNDCQDMHFAFFSATGQFSQAKANSALETVQPLVAVVTSLPIFHPVETSKADFAYNGFHPPPPKADIRIFIQSFQI